MSATTKVNIIARTPFTDRTDPANPKAKMDLVFQLPDGRVGQATIDAADAKTPKEDDAIAAKIKEMPTTVFETKEIKT